MEQQDDAIPTHIVKSILETILMALHDIDRALTLLNNATIHLTHEMTGMHGTMQSLVQHILSHSREER